MSVIAIFDTVIRGLHASEDLKEYISNDPYVSLTLYGLFRQATDGDCTLDSSNDDARSSAWRNCSGMSSEASMREYLNVLGYSLERLDLSNVHPQLTSYVQAIMANIQLARVYQSEQINDSVEESHVEEPTKTPVRRPGMEKPKSALKSITKKYSRVAVSPVFEQPPLKSECSDDSVDVDTPRRPTSGNNRTPHKSASKGVFQNQLANVEQEVMQLVSRVGKTPIRVTSAVAAGRKLVPPTPADKLAGLLGGVKYDDIQLDASKEHPRSIISVLKTKENAMMPCFTSQYNQVDQLSKQNEQLTHVVERQQHVQLEYTQAVAQVAGTTEGGNSIYNLVNTLYNKVLALEKIVQELDGAYEPAPLDTTVHSFLKKARGFLFKHSMNMAYHLFLVLVALVIIRRYYTTFCALQDAVNSLMNSFFP